MDPKLSPRDYALWALIVVAVFLVWMEAGNWGKPPYSLVSPVSQYIFQPYTVVYTGAGVVTALFMGSAIFFAYKFRVREYGEGEAL